MFTCTPLPFGAATEHMEAMRERRGGVMQTTIVMSKGGAGIGRSRRHRSGHGLGPRRASALPACPMGTRVRRPGARSRGS
eukprot:scaffold5466_cov108-Isochrysis_galbana.AAC.3